MKHFLLFLLLTVTQINSACASEWELLEEDLSRLSDPKLTLYKTNLKKFDLSVKKLSDFSTQTPPEDTELLINASFFDTDYKPLGLLLDHGRILNKPHLAGSVLTGILLKKNDFLTIKHREQVNLNQLPSLDFALQAGPRILAAGQILKMKNGEQAERRSGICLNKNRELIIYVTTKNTILSFTELQKILIEPQIACLDALNLDGGSSTQYYFYQDEKLIDSIIGFSSVPIFLRLSPKSIND